MAVVAACAAPYEPCTAVPLCCSAGAGGAIFGCYGREGRAFAGNRKDHAEQDNR